MITYDLSNSNFSCYQNSNFTGINDDKVLMRLINNNKNLFNDFNAYFSNLGLEKAHANKEIIINLNDQIPSSTKGKIGTFHKGVNIVTSTTVTNVCSLSYKNKKIFLLGTCVFIPIDNFDDCHDCDEYDLVYDFECKKYRYFDTKKNVYVSLNNLKDFNIDYKKSFRFKIENLNRYLYTTEIEMDDIHYGSETPALFNTIFLGSEFKSSDLKQLDNSAENSSLKSDIDDINNTYTAFKEEFNKLVENNIKAYSLCLPNVNCCNESYLNSKFLDLSKKLTKLKMSYFDNNSMLIVKIENLTKEIEKEEKALKDEENKGVKKNQSIIDQKNRKIELNKSELKALKSNQLSLEALKSELDKLTDDELLKLVHFENNLIKNNFSYVSPTLYPTGDRFSIKVKIKPNQTEENKKWLVMPLENDEFNIEFRVRNKWFYSFSTGPFIGVGNQFKTENYDWKKIRVTSDDPDVEDTFEYELTKTRNSSLPIGIAAFANLGVKTSDFFGLGGSIGVGSTIADSPQLAYFFGITGFMGQEKQFNFTTGFSFIQVEQLKKELYEFDNFRYNEPETLKFDKKIVNGWFFSISYTVFKPTKESKAKSSVNEDKAAETK